MKLKMPKFIATAMVSVSLVLSSCGSQEPTSVESFDKDTKISVLANSVEMNDFKEFFIYRSNSYAKKLQKNTLKDLNDGDPAWNADDMEYGINHMLDLIHSGVKVDYDFWSEEARSENKDKENTKLFYFPGEEDAPFVLLCAGGGFTAVCNMVEAFPVAAEINDLGYNVFVLSYRTQGAKRNVDFELAVDVALEDVGEALGYIFENADTFNVSTEDYAVGGFSAGSMLLSEWSIEEKGWGKYDIPKPASAFLVYGFTSDLDNVTSDYPPTYMVYCTDDGVINPESMSNLATTLADSGVAYQTNVGQNGGHGFGLGTSTDVEGWVKAAVDFWQGLN